MRKNNDVLVVKHNNLINARYNLTLQEQRIILWLISEIRADDDEFKLYRISISDFARTV